MADMKVNSNLNPSELSLVEKDRLLSWVQQYGLKNGEITARAYELAQESRSNLLAKGAVFLTNGREENLSRVEGKLLRYVLDQGALAGIVETTGVKTKLREIEGFWQRHLGANQPVANVRRRTKGPDKPKPEKAARNFVVYVIKNTVTGRMYFGSTKSAKARWARHRSDLIGLCHSNYELLADTREHGLESFKFFIVARFATRKEMLEREQLLIAMYFNRDACYNLSSSVNPEREAATVPVMLVDRNGDYATHAFLTLHAAVRHYKLSKSAVRAAISAGHGRVGSIRFPVGVPLTAYRTYAVGSRAPRLSTAPAQPASTPKPQQTYYERIKRILDTQPITFDELGRIMSARTSTMSLWSNRNPPMDTQLVLLRFIECYGIEWIRRLPLSEIRGAEIHTFRVKHQLAWVEMDAAMGLRPGSTKKNAAQETVKEKPLHLIFSILLHRGQDPFSRVVGPPTSAFQIISHGVRW